MPSFICRWLMPATLCLAALTAHAQTSPPPTARPDPLDPTARVPLQRYESTAFRTRRVGEAPAVSWREANDTVTRIGGWRVYMREAQQP